jgi:hypothetical protein
MASTTAGKPWRRARIPRGPAGHLLETPVRHSLAAGHDLGVRPAALGERAGDAQGTAEHLGDIPSRQRIVVDDVVRAGRHAEGGDDRGRHVVGVDHRLVRARSAGDDADPSPRCGDHVVRVDRVRRVKHPEARDDARAAGDGEAGGARLGVRDAGAELGRVDLRRGRFDLGVA